MRIVRVRWLDSGAHLDFDRGWRTLTEFMEKAALGTMEAETVGYLMHEDDDVILLGQTHNPTGDNWVGAQMIAKRNVLSREYLA